MTSQVIGFLQTAPSLTRNNVQYYWRVVPGGNPPVQPFFALEGVEYPFAIGVAGSNPPQISSGTFSPTILSGAGTVNYSIQAGFYVKIGTLVHVFGQVTVSSDHTGTTAFSIGNLPFTIATGPDGYPAQVVCVTGYTNVSADAEGLCGIFDPGETHILVREVISAATQSLGLSDADGLSATASFLFSGIYQATS